MGALTIQFWIRFRGFQEVKVETRGWSADSVARRAVIGAIAKFNARWPGVHHYELVCTGMTDGQRTLNSRDVPQQVAAKKAARMHRR